MKNIILKQLVKKKAKEAAKKSVTKNVTSKDKPKLEKVSLLHTKKLEMQLWKQERKLLILVERKIYL